MLKIKISYDKETDAVYLSFGEAVEAESEEIEEGVFARFDPKTKKLVGVTIINFSKNLGLSPERSKHQKTPSKKLENFQHHKTIKVNWKGY